MIVGGTVVYDADPGSQSVTDGVWDYAYDNLRIQTKKTLGVNGAIWVYVYEDRNRFVHAQRWSEDPPVPGAAVLQTSATYGHELWRPHVKNRR